jgi:hypothetical protein
MTVGREALSSTLAPRRSLKLDSIWVLIAVNLGSLSLAAGFELRRAMERDAGPVSSTRAVDRRAANVFPAPVTAVVSLPEPAPLQPSAVTVTAAEPLPVPEAWTEPSPVVLTESARRGKITKAATAKPGRRAFDDLRGPQLERPFRRD